ncbi:MAG: hypothetical protein IAG13_01895 [Deltaproteobacteria bacterium]|nr:hypothetical protein [Nannocystaceae bacterium]
MSQRSHVTIFAFTCVAALACASPEGPDPEIERLRAAPPVFADDFVAPDAGPLEAGAPCCSARSGAGCAIPEVQECVCAEDPYCCTTAWDQICVDKVESLDCGTCPAREKCCVTSSEPGCEDPGTQACVCAADPYCCATAWDSLCVQEVETLGCGTCVPQCSPNANTSLIVGSFDECGSANAIGQAAPAGGVTCADVCCTFGYSGCSHRAPQADFAACAAPGGPAVGTCNQVFAAGWSSQCVCIP